MPSTGDTMTSTLLRRKSSTSSSSKEKGAAVAKTRSQSERKVRTRLTVDTAPTVATSTSGSDGSPGGSPPVKEVAVHKVLEYRLSFKDCGGGGATAGICYTGTTGQNDVKTAVGSLPRELWKIAKRKKQQQQRRRSDAASDCQVGDDFASSEFVRHIIDVHLDDFSSKEDVLSWWKANVAIRIKTHLYEKRQTDGTFDFVDKEKKAIFVQHQHEKEQHYEEVKRRHDAALQERLAQSSVLHNEEVFDVVWMSRYEELREYAAQNGGCTRVPPSYPPSPLLGKWVENQRTGYRRKHNLRPKLEIESGDRVALTDRKEALLKEIGFAWYDEARQRWDERGIDVIYGRDS